MLEKKIRWKCKAYLRESVNRTDTCAVDTARRDDVCVAVTIFICAEYSGRLTH